MNGSFWIVARAPRTIRKHLGGHVFNDGIKHDAIATDRGQRGIGLKLGKDMVVSVIAVQTNQHAFVVTGD